MYHLIAEAIGKYPDVAFEKQLGKVKISRWSNNLKLDNKIRYYESSNDIIECRHYRNLPNHASCKIIKKEQR